MTQTITRTGNLKTYEAWNGPWAEHFLPGDHVDEEMYWYALEVVPPACHRSTLMQMGEAGDHAGPGNCARYETFQKSQGAWVYIGRQPQGCLVAIEGSGS